LFTHRANAYHTLGFYSDNGEFVVAFKHGGNTHEQAEQITMTFARLNKLELDARQVGIAKDGTTPTTTVLPLRRYTMIPGPKMRGMAVLCEEPIAAIICGGSGGRPSLHW
jgi:hypothetical protein